MKSAKVGYLSKKLWHTRIHLFLLLRSWNSISPHTCNEIIFCKIFYFCSCANFKLSAMSYIRFLFHFFPTGLWEEERKSQGWNEFFYEIHLAAFNSLNYVFPLFCVSVMANSNYFCTSTTTTTTSFHFWFDFCDSPLTLLTRQAEVAVATSFHSNSISTFPCCFECWTVFLTKQGWQISFKEGWVENFQVICTSFVKRISNQWNY